VFFAVAAQAADAPETVTKETTGEAAIVDNNKSKAFKEAKDNALRSAVEQVAGVLVSSDTLTKNNQLISDRIFANSAGYVRKFEVLSQKVEKGVMVVTVKAVVGTAQLDKDLIAVQAMVARHGARTMVILLQEQAIDPKGVTTSSGVMSTVLTHAFQKDGWTILDPHFAAGKVKLSAGVSLGNSEAKEIGDLTKAEYILYGTVNFRYQSPSGFGDVDAKTGQPLVFYVTGEYDLALFATDSGSQLAKVAGKLSMSQKGEADFAVLKKMVVSYERSAFDIATLHGPRVVEEVRKVAMEKLRHAEQNGARVVMTVTGLDDYAAVQSFKKAISAINNVREVKPGSFGSGKAQAAPTSSPNRWGMPASRRRNSRSPGSPPTRWRSWSPGEGLGPAFVAPDGLCRARSTLGVGSGPLDAGASPAAHRRPAIELRPEGRRGLPGRSGAGHLPGLLR
jgi:hypothetical protein